VCEEITPLNFSHHDYSSSTHKKIYLHTFLLLNLIAKRTNEIAKRAREEAENDDDGLE